MIARTLLGTAALAMAASIAMAEDVCSPDKIDLRGDWGNATFQIELADDPEERALGLMHRTSLPRGAGMLFIFDKPQPVSFWMRHTLIPLDMIFIRKDGTVHHVHENAIPKDETTIFGGPAILAVLEINGGLSSTFGIAAGSEVRHPAFSPDVAVWSCP
jgi:uncharacterized membrane protein (UPF0127 family)